MWLISAGKTQFLLPIFFFLIGIAVVSWANSIHPFSETSGGTHCTVGNHIAANASDEIYNRDLSYLKQNLKRRLLVEQE